MFSLINIDLDVDNVYDVNMKINQRYSIFYALIVRQKHFVRNGRLLLFVSYAQLPGNGI